MIRRPAAGPGRTDGPTRIVGTRFVPGGCSTALHRSPAWAARPADLLTVQVPAGATLALLLPAVERLLLGLSESRPGCRKGRDPLPLPLAGRVALAALLRVWDGIDQQLHPSLFPPGRSGDAEPIVQVVRLRASDLEILQAAAVALERLPPELAAVLLDATSERAVRALTALLWALIPVPDDASVPDGDPAPMTNPRRHGVPGHHISQQGGTS